MNENFEYGLLARSIFTTLLWLTVLLGFAAPSLLPWHIVLLLFLAFGLKPLLLKTGLYEAWKHFHVRRDERRNTGSDAALSARIDRERRDERLRKTRQLSRELPPKW